MFCLSRILAASGKGWFFGSKNEEVAETRKEEGDSILLFALWLFIFPSYFPRSLLLTSYFPKTIPSTVNDNSPAAELAQPDNAESGALIRCAASLAFAGVLPFAPIITGFAAALAFALVLPFTSMHGLFSCQSLQGNPGMGASRARSVCANRKRTRHKAGDCRPCNDCSGWFNHLSILSSLSLVSGRLRHSTAVLRRQSNIRSLNCARVGILIDAEAQPLFPNKKPV
jgi:hypothetical protein